MKQTNGAILLLQNAFKGLALRSYLKGIATSVVMTAGLAAGAAQAEAINLGASAEEAVPVNSSNTDDTITLSDAKTSYASLL